MKVIILGDSIRKDNSIMRFLVQFPELSTGNFGIQVPLPITIPEIKNAIKARYLEVEQNIIDVNNLKTTYQAILDTEIELGS